MGILLWRWGEEKVVTLRAAVRTLLRKAGYDVVRYRDIVRYLDPPDFDEEARAIIRSVQSYTMTSPERVFALIEAVRYIVQRGIPGSIVECGVWRGGSMMAAALTLKSLAAENVDLYLFDTYEGMTEPTTVDVSREGELASRVFQRLKRREDHSEWCRASLEEVQRNLWSTGYDKDKIKFIPGRVEDTLPEFAPAQIAVLRLDTDWYESTKHELVHLFPRLSSGGVLIIDDYGYWAGARRAVDEYFAQNGVRLLLHRIDDSARIAIKC